MKKENYLFSVLKTNSFWFSCIFGFHVPHSSAVVGIANLRIFILFFETFPPPFLFIQNT